MKRFRSSCCQPVAPIVLLCAMAVLAAAPAFAEKRVALVIGNGAYTTSTTLKNPPADAVDISAALKSAGFAVTTLIDARREAMEKAVRDFGNALRDPDAVGLFYYSGHGAQVEGANYLLPVDADIQAQDELAYKAVNVEQMLAKMRSAGNRLNIVVLDACRNNPFPGSTRSADKGLAVVGVKVPESIIVYATDPGAVAQDGDGRNSPFTKAFITQLAVPGQEISVALRRVTGEVKELTRGAQTPWISTNYTSDFSFRPAGGGFVAATPALSPAAPSKTPSFGAVTAATGNLSITLATAGTVSVAGLSASVPAGTVPVKNLPAGSQTVTVSYADGKSESRSVTVPSSGTVSVVFAYVPATATSVTPISAYKIGDKGPAGGLIFYDKGSVSDGWRYLEAAPVDTNTTKWYNGNYISIKTGTEVGAGRANTVAIVATQGKGSYAAQLCSDLVLGGYDDWFLPSMDELDLMYQNLKKVGLGGFIGVWFWSSSQNNRLAWIQKFSDGEQSGSVDGRCTVRAIRAF